MSLSPLIQVEELLRIFKNPGVLLFDVSNHPGAFSQYEKEHLEGAYFLDLNTQLAEVPDHPAHGGRHPLPRPEVFEQTLAKAGISADSHVVLYDDKGGANAAARGWWMLKAAGLEKVQVLNGGIQEATRKQFPVSAKKEVPRHASVPLTFSRWLLPIADMQEVEKSVSLNDHLVIDVRDKARYEGTVEPLDAVAGHIPGARNVPFSENLDAGGLFLSAEALREKYETLFGNIPVKNGIVHCGSGVTACHTLLAMNYAGMEMPHLYVGSWSEWCNNHPLR
jgi:thiosulfate/3-mercaptopyruvate sulfurtransferase